MPPYVRPTKSMPPAIAPLLQTQLSLAPLLPPVHVVDLMTDAGSAVDRKSTRLNSSHT